MWRPSSWAAKLPPHNVSMHVTQAAHAVLPHRNGRHHLPSGFSVLHHRGGAERHQPSRGPNSRMHAAADEPARVRKPGLPQQRSTPAACRKLQVLFVAARAVRPKPPPPPADAPGGPLRPKPSPPPPDAPGGPLCCALQAPTMEPVMLVQRQHCTSAAPRAIARHGHSDLYRDYGQCIRRLSVRTEARMPRPILHVRPTHR